MALKEAEGRVIYLKFTNAVIVVALGVVSFSALGAESGLPTVEVQKPVNADPKPAFCPAKSRLTVVLPQGERKRILGNLPKVLTQAKADPVLDDGALVGYRLDNIHRKSIYKYIGLKPGDVVLGLDGRPFQSTMNTLMMLNALRTAASVDICIERENERFTHRVRIR